MEILKIRFKYLRNEEWFQFFTDLKMLIQKYGPGTLQIQELYDRLLTQYTDVDAILEVLRKSQLTQKIAEMDTRRDHLYRGLVDTARAALNHPDTGKKEAAQALSDLFAHYGNATRYSADQETAVLHNLLQDLDTPPAQTYVGLLQLSDWTQQLYNANNTYAMLVHQRNAEISTRPDGNVGELRPNLQATYADITERIRALALVTDPAVYDPAPFVNELNTFIKHYNALAARRHPNHPADDADELPDDTDTV